MPEHSDLIRRLAFTLESALPYLDRQAAVEKRTEEGKPLRNITMQQRAQVAREAVQEAYQLLGLDP